MNKSTSQYLKLNSPDSEMYFGFEKGDKVICGIQRYEGIKTGTKGVVVSISKDKSCINPINVRYGNNPEIYKEHCFTIQKVKNKKRTSRTKNSPLRNTSNITRTATGCQTPQKESPPSKEFGSAPVAVGSILKENKNV